MTDVTGKTPTNGAPKPRRSPSTSNRAGGQTAEEPRTVTDSIGVQGSDPTPPDMAASQHGDMSSESAGDQSKTKKPITLNEEDSLLLASLEAAQARAEALRDWALIRREEAKDAVRTNPLGSSIIVFGAGMIFGLLLARR